MVSITSSIQNKVQEIFVRPFSIVFKKQCQRDSVMTGQQFGTSSVINNKNGL